MALLHHDLILLVIVFLPGNLIVFMQRKVLYRMQVFGTDFHVPTVYEQDTSVNIFENSHKALAFVALVQAKILEIS